MDAASQHSFLVGVLFNIALIGGEWVLYLLLILAAVMVAAIIERVLYFARRSFEADDHGAELVERLNRGDYAGAAAKFDSGQSPAAAIVAEAVRNADKGPRVVSEIAQAATVRQRALLERFLPFLATVGSNSPYLGLLGTVLGIIQAFHKLATASAEGPNVVMGGISEALVATAVGLAVAIPAVIAYNTFKTLAQHQIEQAQGLVAVVLAFVEERAAQAADSTIVLARTDGVVPAHPASDTEVA